MSNFGLLTSIHALWKGSSHGTELGRVARIILPPISGDALVSSDPLFAVPSA